MDLEHKDQTDQLILLVDEDDAILAGSMSAEVESLRWHVQQCTSCQDELEQLRRTMHPLRSALRAHLDPAILVEWVEDPTRLQNRAQAIEAHLAACDMCQAHCELLREEGARSDTAGALQESIPAALLARLTTNPKKVASPPPVALRAAVPARRPQRAAWRSWGLLAAAGFAVVMSVHMMQAIVPTNTPATFQAPAASRPQTFASHPADTDGATGKAAASTVPVPAGDLGTQPTPVNSDLAKAEKKEAAGPIAATGEVKRTANEPANPTPAIEHRGEKHTAPLPASQTQKHVDRIALAPSPGIHTFRPRAQPALDRDMSQDERTRKAAPSFLKDKEQRDESLRQLQASPRDFQLPDETETKPSGNSTLPPVTVNTAPGQFGNTTPNLANNDNIESSNDVGNYNNVNKADAKTTAPAASPAAQQATSGGAPASGAAGSSPVPPISAPAAPAPEPRAADASSVSPAPPPPPAQTLAKAAVTHARSASLEDLAGSRVRKLFPDRSVHVAITEQNGSTVAATATVSGPLSPAELSRIQQAVADALHIAPHQVHVVAQ